MAAQSLLCNPTGGIRTMGMRAIGGGLVLVAALAGQAAAKPGDLPDTLHVEDAPLLILDAASAQPCAQKGALCILPGSRSTIAVAATDKAPDGEAVATAAATPERPVADKLPSSKLGK